jgi:hypothetical protein
MEGDSEGPGATETAIVHPEMTMAEWTAFGNIEEEKKGARMSPDVAGASGSRGARAPPGRLRSPIRRVRRLRSPRELQIETLFWPGGMTRH